MSVSKGVLPSFYSVEYIPFLSEFSKFSFILDCFEKTKEN